MRAPHPRNTARLASTAYGVAGPTKGRKHEAFHIGATTFDCVLNHHSTWLIGSWSSSDILLERLAAIDDPLLVGEVYARHDT